jgi:uncharacterized protein
MTSPDSILSSLQLERFFSESRLVYDLEAGTVKNPGAERLIYVSADLMRGIHQALVEETADAWKIIFRNCGRTWGKRVATHLDGGLAKLGKGSQAALPLEGYLAFIEAYFAEHGWGVLKLDLADAPRGLIVARLHDSYFVDVLADVDDTVDALLAGILQGFIEHVAGAELGCAEIACVRKGAPECVFVVTAPARLDAIETKIGNTSAEDILTALRA